MDQFFYKVSSDHVDQRLDLFLVDQLPQSRSRSFVQKLIEQGHVRVNEEKVKSKHKMSVGEDVHVVIPQGLAAPDVLEPEDIPLDIFYEDDSLAVINKPIGLLVHPAPGRYTGSLVNALLHHFETLSDRNTSQRPGIVHRLDEETSGLIVIAKDNIAHARLGRQFQQRKIFKQYLALVKGRVAMDEGVIDVPIGQDPHHRDKKGVSYHALAREAWTRYQVAERREDCTLMKLYPKTGRTHQLRVHMKYLGHPILGDSKYGNKNSYSRLALHAQTLGFFHPQTRHWVEFSSQSPF